MGSSEDLRWEQRFEADYLVGCDGAGSKDAAGAFGNNFPGFTWDKQICRNQRKPPSLLFLPTPWLRCYLLEVLRIPCRSPGLLSESKDIRLDLIHLHDTSAALSHDCPDRQ